MIDISSAELDEYRVKSFHLDASLRLTTREEAISFVNERGFVFFWPISGINYPSLWCAVAGNRPVADAHDDPGHVTWRWKDALLGSRSWYYAKVLRKKSTMISFDLLPSFYALSENYGAYDEDYLTVYEQGRLTMEAKQIYETLLDHGVLDTVALRRKTRLSSPSSESRFAKAMSDLQGLFMILPVAVTESGAWRYSFAYDISARHYPDLPDNAHQISEYSAREKILKAFACSMGVFEIHEPIRLLRWTSDQVFMTVKRLVGQGELIRISSLDGKAGDWYCDPLMRE